MRLWVRSGTLTVALILTLTVAACGAAARTTGGKPSPPPSRATPMPTSSARTAVLATPSFHLKRIATGLIQPLYVTAPPGDTHRLFIVEKTGEIVILRDGVRLAAPFLNISNLVSQASEQGLLCLAFDPHFAANHRLYVSYTDLSNNVRVVRYTVSSGDPDRASPASAKLLLAVPHPFTNHNGGQLAFGPDGLLYIGLGDGGSEGDPRLYGQNLHVLLAKILRMDENAARPRPSICAYGLRNPWRFSFDRANGDLWIGDVGQDRWEEIDYLRAGTPAGTNFGWSYYEGNHVYKPQAIDRARLVFPVHEYSHAYGTSVIGGYVYRGKAIPTLRGWYLFADLSSRRVWLMRGPRGPVGLAAVSGQVGTVASFGEDASGELYLVSLNGQVYKIVR